MSRKNRRNRRSNAKKSKYFDFEMIAVIVMLGAFGLVMLYSATAYMSSIETGGNDTAYFVGQLINYVIGFGAFAAMAHFPYRYYNGKIMMLIVVGAIGLLLMTQIPGLGVTINGATRWIDVGGLITIQPSEFAKIATILYVPWVINRYGLTSSAYKRIGLVGGSILLIVFFLTNHLSTTIIIGGIIASILVVAHKQGAKVLVISLVLMVVVYVGLQVFGEDIFREDLARVEANQEMGIEDDESFRYIRVLAWLYPERFASEESYQTIQGLYALGSGGLWGKGLGNGTQKLEAIPEVQNDMILASIGEELGIIGVAMVLLLFSMLLYRLLFIARNAPDLYSGLIVTGIFTHIALQVILNVGVVTSAIPNTGVTLPFISDGGTALIFLMAEMGIALNISKNIKLPEESEEFIEDL